MSVLEDLLRQWDNMESATFEYRKLGDVPLVSMTLNVKSGKQLTLKRLHFMQPDMAVAGEVRFTVLTEGLSDATASVLIEPQGDGQAAIRFKGLLWGFAKLFAMPLADAEVREIRVARDSGNPQYDGVNVSMLMLASGGGDRRRRLTVHNVSLGELQRSPGRFEILSPWRQLDVSYMTPSRLYYYTRQSP